MGRRVAGASKSMFDDMAVAACTDSSRMIGTIIVVWGGPRVRPGPGCPPAGRRTTHNNGWRKDRHPPTAYTDGDSGARTSRNPPGTRTGRPSSAPSIGQRCGVLLPGDNSTVELAPKQQHFCSMIGASPSPLPSVSLSPTTHMQHQRAPHRHDVTGVLSGRGWGTK